ncbi:LppM family (lipo)protein [Enemella sp. A6]|uniref:LppM family (lipo)protein n=1 Tax=Enemella sp. A6 TaxID=3440152 RepID=UPI003EB9FCE2
MSRLRALVVVLGLPLILLLSGCMRFHADVEILGGGSDEIEYTVIMAVRNKDFEASGDKPPEDPCAGMRTSGPDDKLEPIKQPGPEGFTGCRITGRGGTDALNKLDVKIDKSNGVWTIKVSPEGAAGGEAPPDNSADFRFSVTFPGDVLSHNGSSTLDGRTVTWTDPADLLSKQGLVAQGRDDVDKLVLPGEINPKDAKSGGPAFGVPSWVIAIVVSAVVLAVSWLLIELTIRRKRRGPPSDGPSDGPGTGAGGPAPGQHRSGPSGTWQAQGGQRLPGGPHPGAPYPGWGPQPQGPQWGSPMQQGQAPGQWGGPPGDPGRPSNPDRWAPPN